MKIGPKHQVVIPADVFRRFKLEPGEVMQVETSDKGIIFIPVKLIPKDELWYWSKEWQKKEQAADKAIEEGRVKEFDQVEDLIKDLDS